MTVLVVALAGLLLALAGVVTVLGGVAVARHRAAAAADLAALAAAGHALEGQGAACTAAASVARAQGADLVDCRLDGPAATVWTAVRLGRFGSARAASRAGPVDGEG